MKVFTIGFTQSTAEDFFKRLERAGVERIIDVRLNSTSQLAGFAKAADLSFFLKRISSIEYAHEPLLAPTKEILSVYRKDKDWTSYKRKYIDLLRQRRAEDRIDPSELRNACLLCSEASPDRCHRRLALEYLHDKLSEEFDITHL